MRIILCDDQRQELEDMARIFRETAQLLAVDLSVCACTSGEEAVQAAVQGPGPDLVILDIYMKGLNGMETARRLRQAMPGVPLAFLTSSRDFAVDAFALEALHYLVKPLTPDAAQELLRRLRAQSPQVSRCLRLTGRRESRRFPLGQIRYLTSLDRGVQLYLLSSREWVAAPFHQAVDQLGKEWDFVLISRGCIVNLNSLLYLGSSGCHLKTGECLPVSCRERSKVQARYNEFMFRKMSQMEGKP